MPVASGFNIKTIGVIETTVTFGFPFPLRALENVQRNHLEEI
jgi:hypothetical protein